MLFQKTQTPEFKPDLSRQSDIRQALNRTKETPGASVLVVGYAANGREQGGKSLDVIHEALRKNTLSAGSTVVLHVSGHEKNMGQLKALEKLQLELQKKDINVLIAEAPKSLNDALHNDRLSVFKRKTSKIAGLEDASFLKALKKEELPSTEEDELGALTTSLQQLESAPLLSTKDLMNSLKKIMGADAMAEKVRILTDSNHSLQDAAREAGVPAEHTINQQENDMKFRLKSHEKGDAAGLAETFRRNERNILGKMETALDAIGAKPVTSRAKVRDKAVAYFLKNSPNAAGPQIDRRTQGVLCHDSVRYEKAKVKNIVYISEHFNQELIASHIKAQLAKKPAPQAYKETMFLFCGPKATPGVNSMSLAQVADGDGITNKGAPSNDIHAYLRSKGGSRAGMMRVAPNTRVTTEAEFLKSLDGYIERGFSNADRKYGADSTTKKLNSRIRRSNAISAAHNSLFAKTEEKKEETVNHIDVKSRNSAAKRANERFSAMAHQLLAYVKKNLTNGDRLKDAYIELKDKKKRGEVISISLKDLSRDLASKEKWKITIGVNPGDDVLESDIHLLNKTKALLLALANDKSPKEELEADGKAFARADRSRRPTTQTFMALRELENEISQADASND